MAGKEKLFENKIKDYLTSKGCWYVKFFANSFTKAGIPDILACVNGRFVGIEVKAATGHPSELQLAHQKQIRKAGGVSIIIYPNQFDLFKEMINAILENKEFDQTVFDKTKH